jgi:hypothetical protein
VAEPRVRRWLTLVFVIVTAIASMATTIGTAHAHRNGSARGVLYNYDGGAQDAPTRPTIAAARFAAAGGSSVRPVPLGGTSPPSVASVVAAEEGLPALRQAYVDDVASISDNAAAWEKAGADPEFIARESWADRRALGIQYKGLTPPDMLEQITARNVARYGDPLGPSVDWLRAQGRTWQQIIESATRPGGQDLGF